MDNHLEQRIFEYVKTAYAAALHSGNLTRATKIAETLAQLAQKGIILSGQTIHQVAKIQGDYVNALVQARADAQLDAYELYGAEIDGAILADAKSVRLMLLGNIFEPGNSGLPPGAPALQMFPPLLETNTGAIVDLISCQIEQRKVVPKFKRTDNDRSYEEMAIQEARQSVAEDLRAHPKVGAVVVKDGKVVSKAHRGENPGCHAEYTALEGKLAADLVAGATVFTTLEPCTTRKHPKIPCAERLIARRVGRVVIGMLDPNPEIRGLGVQALNDAGIETQLFPRDLQIQIEELNREFIRAQKERQARAIASSTVKPTAGHEANPKIAEIIKHKGETVTVFNRQKYGNGYLEGFWANGAVIVDCTPLWIVLEDPVAKSQQSFPLASVEVGFRFRKESSKIDALSIRAKRTRDHFCDQFYSKSAKLLKQTPR